jgi:hypothetical protein
MNTFGQVLVHIRHHGGAERPEPCARTWFVHMDKSGVCVWSLVVAVLRALGRGVKGVWAWVEWHSRSTPTTLWHDGRNNSAEVPAGGQHLQKKGGSAGKVVVRGPKGINAPSLVRIGNHIDALVTSHRKCINFFRSSRHRVIDCGVKHVLERKGGKEQGGLADLMKFRIW